MSESIYSWIKAGLIKPEQVQQGLEMAGQRPNRPSWLEFIKVLLILMGLLSLAFGVVFFFAYNWNEMNRMFKFITLQVVLVGLFVLYIVKAKSNGSSQALLLAGVVILGALLALFGQTYQTGADPWQLFSTWALLITPMVLFCRSEALWIVMAVLLNTALSLYLHVNRSFFGMPFLIHHLPWVFLLLNTALLACVEWLSQPQEKWLQEFALSHRWAAQVLAVLVIYILAVTGMEAIWGGASMRGMNLLFYMLFMAATFAFYRYVHKDLLLLTAWALALIVFILALLANTVFDNFDAGGLLLMAISLIAMSTFAVSRIKKIHELFKAEQPS